MALRQPKIAERGILSGAIQITAAAATPPTFPSSIYAIRVCQICGAPAEVLDHPELAAGRYRCSFRHVKASRREIEMAPSTFMPTSWGRPSYRYRAQVRRFARLEVAPHQAQRWAKQQQHVDRDLRW